MKQFTGSFIEKSPAALFVILALFTGLLLLVSLEAHATTTVTVDNNDKVIVTQPVTYVPVTAVPAVVTREAVSGDFGGRIVEINYLRPQILVHDTNGRDREVLVQSEMINNYRIGDTVLIHPTTTVTLITMEENPKDFEGGIIRVDIPKRQIVVQDTNGRERKVQLKEGMIGNYKVDDYVQVHLMSDLKEAKTIETVRNIRRLEGNIVKVDSQASRMVIRDMNGRERTVLVRQGMITSYSVGNQVQVYQLADREDVQLVRIIRIA